MKNAVEQYIDALQERDWQRMRATMTPDVRREGPEGADRDAVVGLDDYMTWTVALLDDLHGFTWTPDRVVTSADGRSVFVEATSEYEPHEGDARFGYRLAVIFDLAQDGRIAEVSYYWKTPGDRLRNDTISGAAAR